MPAISDFKVNLILVLVLRTSYLGVILLQEGRCVHVLLIQIPLVQGRRGHRDKVENFHSFSS